MHGGVSEIADLKIVLSGELGMAVGEVLEGHPFHHCPRILVDGVLEMRGRVPNGGARGSRGEVSKEDWSSVNVV